MVSRDGIGDEVWGWSLGMEFRDGVSDGGISFVGFLLLWAFWGCSTLAIPLNLLRATTTPPDNPRGPQSWTKLDPDQSRRAEP